MGVAFEAQAQSYRPDMEDTALASGAPVYHLTHPGLLLPHYSPCRFGTCWQIYDRLKTAEPGSPHENNL